MSKPEHPNIVRRTALKAGAIGILGLGSEHISRLHAETKPTTFTAKNVIYVFLSGGLAQQDSFDMKPDAPEEIRGEFNPLATMEAVRFLADND